MPYFRLISGRRESQSCVFMSREKELYIRRGSDGSLAGWQHPGSAWTVCSEQESREALGRKAVLNLLRTSRAVVFHMH